MAMLLESDTGAYVRLAMARAQERVLLVINGRVFAHHFGKNSAVSASNASTDRRAIGTLPSAIPSGASPLLMPSGGAGHAPCAEVLRGDAGCSRSTASPGRPRP